MPEQIAYALTVSCLGCGGDVRPGQELCDGPDCWWIGSPGTPGLDGAA